MISVTVHNVNTLSAYKVVSKHLVDVPSSPLSTLKQSLLCFPETETLIYVFLGGTETKSKEGAISFKIFRFLFSGHKR